MEKHDEIKIAKIKNLGKVNWNANMNILIDSNVNINNILEITAYTYDEKIECGNERASVSGKIGVKVVYIDTDNICNSLTESVPFNEVYSNPAITSSSHMVICDTNVSPTIISTDGMLKLNLNCTIGLNMYLSLGLNTSIGEFDGLVTKKSNVNTFSLEQVVDTSFEYTSTLETTDNVSKVLCAESWFCIGSVNLNNGFVTIEGKMTTTLCYDSIVEDATQVKQLRHVDNVKLDVAIENISNEDVASLTFLVDPSKLKIETEQDNDNIEIGVTNTVLIRGAILRPIEVETVVDAYSCDNELTLSTSKREYLSSEKCNYSVERVSCESTIGNELPPIDELVGVVNQGIVLTQYYLKDGAIYVEGVINSTVVYKDESAKYYSATLECPFVLDTKVSTNNLDSVVINMSCLNVEAKSKHQDTISLEYDLGLNINTWECDDKTIVDNIVLGKPIEFKNVDYQIYIAKPGETNWDLCKRTKSSLEKILTLNKNLPETLSGGEKIIIKR